MELKPGYKQTEVGVIPKDWNVTPLVSLATEIGDGIHSTPRYVKSSEFHFVNGNNFVDDSIKVTEETMCVSEAEYKALRKNLTDQTLLLSINGTIGNVALYSGERVVLGKSAAYINVSKKISREFISFCLKSRSTALFFENELTGTTIRNLSLQSLRNTPVPLPSTREEQRAIAKALSDVDALISALDQLIAKKRDIKQAAMQQLLTGKRRLPGFHGEWGYKQTEVGAIPKDWEVAKLSEVCSMKSGLGITSTNIDQFSEYRCYGGNGLRGYTKSFTHDGSHALIGRQGALCGNVLGVKGKFFASEHAIVVSSLAQTHIPWLTIVLSRMRLNQYSESSAQPGLSVSKLLSLDLALPSTKNEQAAIANVLSDMDAELTALEQRRDKTRALKQGMMQELLTGKTRLV